MSKCRFVLQLTNQMKTGKVCVSSVSAQQESYNKNVTTVANPRKEAKRNVVHLRRLNMVYGYGFFDVFILEHFCATLAFPPR